MSAQPATRPATQPPDATPAAGEVAVFPGEWAGFLRFRKEGFRMLRDDAGRRDLVLALLATGAALLPALYMLRSGADVLATIALWFVVGGAGLGVLAGWLPARPLRVVAAPLAFLVVGLLIACVYSIDRTYSFRAFRKQHLLFLLTFCAVSVWAVSWARQRILLGGLAIGGATAAAVSIVLYYVRAKGYVYTSTTDAGEVYYRAQGLYQSYTRGGGLYILTLPATAWFFLRAFERGRVRPAVFWALAGLVSCWFLLLTNSRGAWLATTAAIAATFLFRGGRRAIRYLLWLVGIALLPLIFLRAERERAITLIVDASDPNRLLSRRVELWEQAASHIRENFWNGIGHGGNIYRTKEAMKRYPLSSDRVQGDPHNTYLQLLSEGGVIGFAGYTSVMAALGLLAVQTLWRQRRHPAANGVAVAAASGAGLLLFAITFYFLEDHLGQLCWTLAGLIPAGAWAARQSSGEERGA